MEKPTEYKVTIRSYDGRHEARTSREGDDLAIALGFCLLGHSDEVPCLLSVLAQIVEHVASMDRNGGVEVEDPRAIIRAKEDQFVKAAYELQEAREAFLKKLK